MSEIDELQKEALSPIQAELDAFEQEWEKAHASTMLPGLAGYGEDKLDEEQLLIESFDKIQDTITAAADKGVALEKKLAKVHGGYTERSKKLRSKIVEAAEYLAKTKVEAQVQQQAQVSEEAGIAEREADLALLDSEELGLVRLASHYPRVVEGAAVAHEPHRIAFYLYELAAAFHALWNRGNDDPSRRFLLEAEPDLSRARLALAGGIGQILRNGLALMGVEAAEEMR